MIEKLQKICKDTLGVDPSRITPDTHIVNDLNADSLDVVELIMAIEETFDVSISDHEAEKMETVGDLITHLESIQ